MSGESQPHVTDGRRLAIVTPHPWHIPHPVNDHVAELAEGLHRLHVQDPESPDVVVVAGSSDAGARRRTRRALRQLARGADPAGVLAAPELDAPEPGVRNGDLRFGWPLLAVPVAYGPATVSLRSALRIVLTSGAFTAVQLHDPLDAEITRVVARRWSGLTLATFHTAPASSVLSVIAGALRERILDGVDRWLVPEGSAVAEQLDAMFDIASDSIGVVPTSAAKPLHDVAAASDRELQRSTIVIGRAREDEVAVRELFKSARTVYEGESAEFAVLGRWDKHHRPVSPRWLRGRLQSISAATRSQSDAHLARARAFIAMPGIAQRAVEEARANGAPVVDMGELSAKETVEQLRRVDTAHGGTPPEKSGGATAARAGRIPDVCDIARGVLAEVRSLESMRHVHVPPRAVAERTCLIDLHMHTNHSWDCATDPEALLYGARKVGLTAIAVTDHNEVSGALACAELADEYGIQVIVGEEVKTSQGEVIGLFLRERIEPGLSWVETIERIRAQDGLVYVPHPFDRLHTIPDIHTLRDSLDEIDLFEIYNSRLTFEQYNRDAERFARKYNLLEGAGSDAHVVQGLGTAAVYMPAWDDPESFLVALGQGEIIRRPKSLLYLQGLKRVAQIAGKAGVGKPDRE